MGKLIAIIVIAAIVYFAYPYFDVNGAKQDVIENMKKEKTVDFVNKSRQKNQEYINDALDGE